MSSNELSIPFVYAKEVYAAAIVLPLLAASVIAARFRVRTRKGTRVGVDDWMILAALFPTIGMGICLVYGTAKKAIGYPSPPYPTPMDPSQLEYLYETTPQQDIVFRMDWIIWVLMVPANGLIKLSCLFLYRRVFVITKLSLFDIINWVVIAICSLWTAAYWLAQIFGCGNHFSGPFGNLAEVASCNTNIRLDTLMITDLITDIVVWLLPIPVVWRLHMSTIRKLNVTWIFLLAAMSLGAAVVRLIVQEEISNGGYAAHTDPNLTLTILLYWSMIESGLALIAACLPTLGPLFSPQSARQTRASFSRLLHGYGNSRSNSEADRWTNTAALRRHEDDSEESSTKHLATMSASSVGKLEQSEIDALRPVDIGV